MLNLYNITIEAVLNEDPQERSSEVSPDLVQMRLLVLWGLHPIWGPGPGLQGFRAEPETATRWWSPWEVQSQTEEGSMGRVCGTQETSQDLDLALGLRSAGHWVCLLLFAEGVFCEWEVFRNVPQEQVHLGIWSSMFNWWVPWTGRLRRRNRGLWDPGLKAWVPPSLLSRP